MPSLIVLAYTCKSDYSPTTANMLDANALRSSIWLPVFLSVTGGTILYRVRERIKGKRKSRRGRERRNEKKYEVSLSLSLSQVPINSSLLIRARDHVIATRYNDQTHCPWIEGDRCVSSRLVLGSILRLECPRTCTREECSVCTARTRSIFLSEPRYASLSSAKRPFLRTHNTFLWQRPLWRN